MLKVTIETRREGGSTVDKLSWPIPCPKCSHETEQTLATLKGDPILTCPACAHQFQVQTGGTGAELANGVEELDRAFDRLGRG